MYSVAFPPQCENSPPSNAQDEDVAGHVKFVNRRHGEMLSAFHSKLLSMGMHVFGDYNSPVIPALIYVPGKLCAFSDECYARGLAVSEIGALSLIFCAFACRVLLASHLLLSSRCLQGWAVIRHCVECHKRKIVVPYTGPAFAVHFGPWLALPLERQQGRARSLPCITRLRPG